MNKTIELNDLLLTKFFPGFFIAIEGLDASGKSYIIKQLTSELEQDGYIVKTFHDPDKSYLNSEEIFNLSIIWPSNVRALFMQAFRYNTSIKIHDWVKLSPKHIAIVDRYTMSTMIYQGTLGGCDDDILMISTTQGTLEPDMTIYTSIDFKTSIKRKYDRLVKEGIDVSEARQKYDEMTSNEAKFNMMNQAYIKLVNEFKDPEKISSYGQKNAKSGIIIFNDDQENFNGKPIKDIEIELIKSEIQRINKLKNNSN